LEQRRYPRYQLTTPLTGVVEQEGERYPGSVLNISAGGFYLHLPRLVPSSLKVHGADDYGEIHHAGRSAFGFGNLVRIERFSNGVGIGFSWDREGMDVASSVLIGELIREQEQKRVLGRVTTIGTDIVLGGHVSSAISTEVLNCLRSIGSDKARLSLADCTSIDSSGIDMLMSLRDRGVPIVNINPEVESITQRFQLSPASPEKKTDDAG
jgi:anti-anti-sigma regulatory factor